MQIMLPTPIVRTIGRAQIATLDAYYTHKFNREEKKAAKKAAEYDKYIAEAQAKIGPYVPVSYTQVWA